MMNYDSKKTLTENKLSLNEAVDFASIYNLLLGGASNPGFGGRGTDIKKLDKAFNLIRDNIKTGEDLVALNKYLAQKKPEGYSSLQELINGELGYRNKEEAEYYKNILNKIPGITANYKVSGSNSMDKNSFTITYRKPITQKPAENKKTEQTSIFGKTIENYPVCVQNAYKISGGKISLESYNKWSVRIKDTYYFPFAEGSQEGDYYSITSEEGKKGIYYCAGSGQQSIISYKKTGTSETPKGGSNQINSQASNPNQQTVSNIGNTEQDLEAGKVIARGSRGDFVKQIQLKLFNAAEGWAYEFIQSVKNKPGKTPLDGIFGRVTQSVVKQYQQNNQITPANGQVNKATWEKLKNVAVTTTYNPETEKTANVSSEIETLPSKKIGISSDTESLPSQSPSSNTPSSPSQQASTDDILPT